MSRLVLVVILGATLAMLDAGVTLAAERWRMPIPQTAVVGAFNFEQAEPYAGGRRRGIDLRGVPGARVVAPCAGTVTYAGRVPGWGRGVSLRCGGLVATELGLASASVARGARVWSGAVVGRLAPRGLLRLGARRAGMRHGYVDPLGLLSGGERFAPPVVAPRGGPVTRSRSPSGLPAAPVPNMRSVTAIAPVRTPHPAAAVASRAPALSWPAWAGLALLAAAVGGGGTSRWRRRGWRRTGMALAQR